jgi:hypothetical protein
MHKQEGGSSTLFLVVSQERQLVELNSQVRHILVSHYSHKELFEF